MRRMFIGIIVFVGVVVASGVDRDVSAAPAACVQKTRGGRVAYCFTAQTGVEYCYPAAAVCEGHRSAESGH